MKDIRSWQVQALGKPDRIRQWRIRRARPDAAGPDSFARSETTPARYRLSASTHAVIVGRVVDEDREPVAYAQVQTMRYRYNQGKKQLAPYGGGSTNDLGEYRIFGLPPGRYYISATHRGAMMMMMDGMSQDRSANQQPDEDYTPAYYPGTTDPATAAARECNRRSANFVASILRFPKSAPYASKDGSSMRPDRAGIKPG